MNEHGLYLFEIEVNDHKWWISAKGYREAWDKMWELPVSDEFDPEDEEVLSIEVLSKEEAHGLTIENLEDESKPNPIWPMHEAATETTEHGSTMWRA